MFHFRAAHRLEILTEAERRRQREVRCLNFVVGHASELLTVAATPQICDREQILVKSVLVLHDLAFLQMEYGLCAHHHVEGVCDLVQA